MAMYNLGTMGERRESPLHGVAKGVSKWTEGLAKSKTEHAKRESDKQEKSRAYFRNAYKSYSAKKLKGEHIGEKEEKEFLKATKKYLPEWFDQDGQPIMYPVEKEPTPEEENKIKLNLERMKRKLPPSPEGAAAIIKMIQYQMDYGDLGEEEGEKAKQFYMKFIQPSRYSGELQGEGQGQGKVNQADPLSILGR